MVVAAIQGALGSLKTAAGIVKSIMAMKVTAEVQDKVIELQGVILEAQTNAIAATTAQYELHERVRELEAALAAREDWARESQRYALVAMWGGAAQAYALKQEACNGEPPHLVCPQCFATGKKGMLAPIKRDGDIYYVCPQCKNTMATGFRGIGGPQYAEQYVERKANRGG
jgi:hypothetical protein